MPFGVKSDGSNLLTGDRLSYRCGVYVLGEIGGREWVTEGLLIVWAASAGKSGWEGYGI